MSKLMIILTGWLIVTARLSAAPLTAGEWFIDSDPGEGQGTPITGVSGDTLSQDITIAPATIDALSNGPHLLGIRFQDDANDWSQVNWQLFLVTHPGNNLVAGEYFLNSDPGEGAALPLSDINGNIVSVTPTLALDGLPSGVNLLGIRFKNSAEEWGQTSYQVFLNPEPAPQALASLTFALFKDETELSSGTFLGDGSLVIDLALVEPETTLNESELLVLQLQAVDDLGKPGHKFATEIAVKSFTQDFLDTFFTPAEQTNPSLSGELADADLDGISNLLEQATGLNPRIANSTSDATELNALGGAAKTFRFRAASESIFNPTASTFSLGSLRFEIEVSDNAETWSKATSPADFTIAPEGEANDDGSFSHVLNLIEGTRTKGFHRLRVIQE